MSHLPIFMGREGLNPNNGKNIYNVVHVNHSLMIYFSLILSKHKRCNFKKPNWTNYQLFNGPSAPSSAAGYPTLTQLGKSAIERSLALVHAVVVVSHRHAHANIGSRPGRRLTTERKRTNTDICLVGLSMQLGKYETDDSLIT